MDTEADPKTGGETVIAVPQLKFRGAAFSERTFGRITGGKNSSSTERTGEARRLPVRDVITSAAIKARWSVNTTSSVTYRQNVHPFESSIINLSSRDRGPMLKDPPYWVWFLVKRNAPPTSVAGCMLEHTRKRGVQRKAARDR
jgi:hypothetical protein